MDLLTSSLRCLLPSLLLSIDILDFVAGGRRNLRLCSVPPVAPVDLVRPGLFRHSSVALLLILKLPGLSGLLPGAIGHQVADFATRTAAAVVRRGAVRQQAVVEEIILKTPVSSGNLCSVGDGWSGVAEETASIDERLLDVDVHSSTDSNSEIVVQLKWILDGDARRVPHFLKLCEGFQLTDTHNQLPVIPVTCIETEELDPQLTDTGPVL